MVKPTLMMIAALLGTGCLEDVSVGLSESIALADAGMLQDAGPDARLDGAVRDASLVSRDASARDASSPDAGLYQVCPPGRCAIFGISMSEPSTPSCDDGGLSQCLQTATEPCSWVCL